MGRKCFTLRHLSWQRNRTFVESCFVEPPYAWKFILGNCIVASTPWKLWIQLVAECLDSSYSVWPFIHRTSFGDREEKHTDCLISGCQSSYFSPPPSKNRSCTGQMCQVSRRFLNVLPAEVSCTGCHARTIEGMPCFANCRTLRQALKGSIFFDVKSAAFLWCLDSSYHLPSNKNPWQ